MRKLFTVDNKKAFAYMREQLNLARELSTLFLDLTDFSKGRYSTYLPFWTPEDLITSFNSSLVLTGVYQLEEASGDKTHEFIEEARFIKSFLKTEQRYAIWENQLDRVGESHIDEAKFVPKPYFIYDQTLFHPLGIDSEDTNTILDKIAYLSSYPSIIVLTRYNEQIKHKSEIDKTQLNSLATSALHVLVASHDNESWLIWTKNP